MAKRKREITKNLIEKRIKEGRGQNQGKDYRPWLTIRDVPSEGLVSRIKGWKTGRVHHFLSQLELNYFYILDWSNNIIDIREQYPLPLDETQRIAERLGIKHPIDPKTKENIVMTTDFVIDLKKAEQIEIKARSVKPSSKLNNKRTIEKLEIERTYWSEKGVDWGIVTEKEIPMDLVLNISIIHSAKDLSAFSDISDRELAHLKATLLEKIKDQKISLAKATSEIDQAMNFKPGLSLSIFYFLLANKIWKIDMNKVINPAKPIAIIN